MPEAPSSTLIRQGRIGLSFHEVVGEVVLYVLEQLGYDVEHRSDPHEAAFAAHKGGETDILVGWFDGSHGQYVESYRDQVLHLQNVIYEPYCIWGVPDYVPERLVRSVSDLLKPQVTEKMAKTIQGINPGAGISRFSEEIITEYGLDKEGFHFRPGAQEECFSTFEEGFKEESWLVIPLWHPQFLHSKYNIRALEEPKGLLRGKDCAQLIIHKNSLHKFDPSHIDILKRITLGNKAVTTMDSYHHVHGLTYKQAALRWIAENKTRVASWFHPTPAEKLAKLDITLPTAPAAAGTYRPFNVSRSGLIETSFQLPWVEKTLAYQGIVVPAAGTAYQGSDTVTEEQAIEACKVCTLNLLAQLSDASDGDLTRVRLIRLEGFVASGADMVDSPKILNVASVLLTNVLGSNGEHSRTALQLPRNPLNVPVMLGAHAELLW